MNKVELDDLLAATVVGEECGVGWRISPQLSEGGIRTSLDLTRIDLATVKRCFSVVLERTVWELQSTLCIDLGNEPSASGAKANDCE